MLPEEHPLNIFFKSKAGIFSIHKLCGHFMLNLSCLSVKVSISCIETYVTGFEIDRRDLVKL